MDTKVPVVVAEVSTEAEASVIRSLLESYDIPCHYTAGMPSMNYADLQSIVNQIKIYVAASFEREARHILEEHLRNQSFENTENG